MKEDGEENMQKGWLGGYFTCTIRDEKYWWECWVNAHLW